MTIAARAVAGGGMTSPTCICLEAPTGQGLGMSNNAGLNANQCGVTVDSSGSNAVGVVGSATLNALSLGTVSSAWNNNGNINNNGLITSSTKIIQGITTQCKPVITVPTLPSGLPCYSNPIQGWTAANNYTGVYTLPLAGETTMSNTVCYTSLDTSQSASVTLSPGYTYYIQGNFNTGGGAPVTGNGIQMYVGGNVNIANGVTANLSAPTVNGVPQTLFYAMGSTVTIQGGSNTSTRRNSRVANRGGTKMPRSHAPCSTMAIVPNVAVTTLISATHWLKNAPIACDANRPTKKVARKSATKRLSAATICAKLPDCFVSMRPPYTCHPEPPEPISAKRDRRRTVEGPPADNQGRAAVNHDASAEGVLRPSSGGSG